MKFSRDVHSVDREPAAHGRFCPASTRAALLGFARQATRLGFLLIFLSANLAAATESTGIHGVSISRAFFNPTLGQKMRISFSIGASGSLTFHILDRDGFLVRKLVSEKPVQKGKLSFEWDGRDDRGEVVPNEAYSFKIDLVGEGRTGMYFPANSPATEIQVQPKNYDRRRAILSYVLPEPSRVLIRASTGRIDPKTKKLDGPILKTLVNWEPRAAGSVVEYWNGFAESDTIFIPDLPNFMISVAAQALPENSVITVGKRSMASQGRGAKRTGQSLFTLAEDDKGRSASSQPLPKLSLKPKNASWSSAKHVWTSAEKNLRVAVSVTGPSAASFSRQPGSLHIFLDQKPVREVRTPPPPENLDIPIGQVSPGNHVIAFNWVSDYGPVTVNSFRVRTGTAGSQITASKR